MLSEAYSRLEALNPSWRVELGVREGAGWLLGASLREAGEGPLHALLMRIQDRLGCADRKVVAASFALRFGWSSAVAIGPFLIDGSVPDVRLENISLRFSDNGALFERVSLHALRDFADEGEPRPPLLQLRAALSEQATPVVDALHRWSRLPRKVLWGQVASSWSCQFEPILQALGRGDQVLQEAAAFFDDDTPPFVARPKQYVLSLEGVTQVHHCRASCCLFYKVAPSRYCSACPLIDEQDRLARNLTFLEQTVARQKAEQT